ncbi:MAG: hypothetical protein U1F60_00245 [Planctomycetota bacterium]
MAQLPIFPGNILVSRVGDGTATITSDATARFLDEYTPAGVLVQTFAMPTTAVAPNFALTNSGSADSEGYISQSADGNYFILVGYDAPVGTGSVATTPTTTVRRVIGRMDIFGNVDTSTASPTPTPAATSAAPAVSTAPRSGRAAATPACAMSGTSATRRRPN